MAEADEQIISSQVGERDEHDQGDGAYSEEVYVGAPQDLVVFPSGAHTTTQTSPDFINNGGRGIVVTLKTTVIGTGSVTLAVNGKDPASGAYFPLLTGAAVITNVTNEYTLFPGAAVTSNVSADAELPRVFQITVTANNANAATYSVGATILA